VTGVQTCALPILIKPSVLAFVLFVIIKAEIPKW
jgi:hypothetical protein